MRKNNNLKALTLIEVLTYVALFAFIFITIIQFVITVKQTNDEAMGRSNIERAMIFVLNHFNSSFNVANSIIMNESSFNTDNGVLKIESVDKQLYYFLSESKIMFRDNGESYPLTDGKYIITKMYFEEIRNNDLEPLGVRLTLNMNDSHNESISKEITTGFLLR